MVEYSPKVLELIKKFSNYIDNNDFEQLYYYVSENRYAYYGTAISSKDIGEITQLFYNAGIDPLIYMNHIPDCYLCEAPYASFKIPSHIEFIGEFAFAVCTNLSEMFIPDKITKIKVGTFRACKNLTKISLPGGLTDIYNEAFEFCDNLKEVEFRGTKEQFKSIKFNAFNGALLNAKIICTDGVI